MTFYNCGRARRQKLKVDLLMRRRPARSNIFVASIRMRHRSSTSLICYNMRHCPALRKWRSGGGNDEGEMICPSVRSLYLRRAIGGGISKCRRLRTSLVDDATANVGEITRVHVRASPIRGGASVQSMKPFRRRRTCGVIIGQSSRLPWEARGARHSCRRSS